MAKLRTHTLGCKVNQYETELVREGLLRAGFEDAVGDEPADLCIVNTCTITAEGDAKSRQVIRRLARDNQRARIVVMGCYATRAPEDVGALPGVAEVITDKREIPDLLGRFGVVDLPDGISRFGNRHRAYVKVQDGCLLRCSYCIIPQVRPQMSSRPMAEIVSEVTRLIRNGYQEIVLTGIHLGHYGVDKNRLKPKSDWLRLADLVRTVADLSGNFRVRLSSIEATEVTRELLDVMAAYPKRICPHLHLCLQSGSDRVLARMNRRWGTKRFIDRCHSFQQRFDRPAITTDIIVGFPGESDEDFEATCEVARQCGFSKIHIFPFSPRQGTRAALMSETVPKRIQKQRIAELARVEQDLRERYFASLVGSDMQLLVEALDPSGQLALGTSCRYAPIRFSVARGEPHPRLGELIAIRAQANLDSTAVLAVPASVAP
jgi:threonylcarbamoyladenosine tRNA methylthiotransferase MtaB